MSSGLSVSTRKMSVSQRMAPSLPLPPPPALSLSTNFPDISSMITGLSSAFSAGGSAAARALLTPNGSTNEDGGIFGAPTGEVVCWLVDTRSLWPGSGSSNNIWSAAGAAEALALLPLAEQKAISAKMFLPDARMSLASALLKRLFISQTLDIAWKDVALARKGDPKHGKPCAVDVVGRPIDGIDFNVSHQAGLVALIGWNGKKRQKYSPGGGVQGFISPGAAFEPDVMVGVDIVCVNERDDYRTIDAEGLDGWVDIYDYVFSDEERWTMKYDVDSVTLLDGTVLPRDVLGRHDRCIARNKLLTVKTPQGQDIRFNSDCLIDAKLRRFYTFFCYKEAYIKLAGEALLAPWLKQLEFFNVRSPRPGAPARCSTHGQWGEEVDDVEVHLHGNEVRDVRMKIQAFEENFMIATAIQGQIVGLQVPAFRRLDLRADILSFAHKHLSAAPSEVR